MNDKCNPTPFRTSKKGLKAEQKKKTRDEKSLWQDRIYQQKSHIKCDVLTCFQKAGLYKASLEEKFPALQQTGNGYKMYRLRDFILFMVYLGN